MSKSGFGQMYRKLSSKLLDLVVTPHVLGEVPSEVTTPTADQIPAAQQKNCLLYLCRIIHAVMRW